MRGHRIRANYIECCPILIDIGREMERASYYDIAPTILDLQRLMKSDRMRGRSLVQNSEEGPQR